MLFRRFGHHRVAIVIQPIDQRPNGRILLILDQRRVIKRSDQGAFFAKDVEKILVVDVESERTRRRIEVGTIDKKRYAFLRIKMHHLPNFRGLKTGPSNGLKNAALPA